MSAFSSSRRCTGIVILVLAALCAIGPSAASAQTSVWEIDTAATSVEFSVPLLSISRVRGKLRVVGGTVLLRDDPTLSRVEVTIDPDSVDTNVAKRDRHLRNQDFFDVDRFPAMTFRSTQVTQTSDGRWKVTGDLTIRDHTRPVVLDVENVTPLEELMHTNRVRARATTQINRRDFGITYTGMAIGNTVDVSIDVEVFRSDEIPSRRAALTE